MNTLTQILDYGPSWTLLLALGITGIGLRFAAQGRAERRHERVRAARRRLYARQAEAYLPPHDGSAGSRAGYGRPAPARPPGNEPA